ncbi:MAG: SGNH/GDSL hydrolase family protein, partial [Planctomycetota bacterium]
RLPARAEKLVRKAVWNLSRHSAGLFLRFVTDAPEIHVAWELTSSKLAMPHMAATGVSGVDLYARSDAGKWHWIGCGRPSAQKNTQRVVSGLPAGKREFLAYLPLYNGVKSVEIGVPKNKTFAKAKAWPTEQRKPIVFYGTSITQGACASRPGMAHTAILGRWLERPVINLGFSGNGTMEAEVAKLIAEIDAALYVIDCLPNLKADAVTERTAPLVKILRKARPKTPILLVEDRNYADGLLVRSKRERNRRSQAALRGAFERLENAGVSRLYYLEGRKLLGEDGEDTVDSSHPTDLGFWRHAKAFREVIVPILKKGES